MRESILLYFIIKKKVGKYCGWINFFKEKVNYVCMVFFGGYMEWCFVFVVNKSYFIDCWVFVD